MKEAMSRDENKRKRVSKLAVRKRKETQPESTRTRSRLDIGKRPVIKQKIVTQ